MSAFWNYVTRMTSGTLAKAEDVNTNFDGVDAGLDLIEIEIDKAVQITSSPGVTDIVLNAAARANKLLEFDVNGDIAATTIMGDWKSDHADAAGTDYQIRDVVKDAAGSISLNSLYICISTHTSTGGLAADTANWELLLDADVVAAAQVSVADAGGLITATDVEGALQEAFTEIDINTAAQIANALALTNLTASEVINVPAGSIAATDVQAAIDELDTEKAALASPALTGNPTAPTQSADDNSTKLATTAYVDSIGAIAKSIFTAVGDILFASGASTPAALAKGEEGQSLNMGASNLPEWGAKPSMRQTVLAGAVAAATGYANFISAGTGLAADLAATSTTIHLTYASGFSKGSPIDYGEKITADAASAWSGLTANAINFLYREYGVGYGKVVNLPPVYGPTYVKAGGSGRSYLDCDGADTATTLNDANPDNTVTFNGTAQLDTAQKKFGTASILLDGNSDYVDVTGPTIHAGENEGGFGMSCRFRLNAIGAIQTIFGSVTGAHFRVQVHSTNYLRCTFGDGNTGTIANGVLSTTTVLAADKWYKVRMMWDGATYKIYLSDSGAAETEEISVTSSTAFAAEPLGIRIGAEHTPTEYFNGWIDDFYYGVGPQTVGTETPDAFAHGLATDTEHWFDTTRMVMSYWNVATAAWVDTQRVFLGECTTDGSSVTSAITYQLRGEYTGALTTYAASTTYVISHNLGIKTDNVLTILECISGERSYLPGDKIFIRSLHSDTAVGASNTYSQDRNTAGFVNRSGMTIPNKDASTFGTLTATSWKYIFEASRGW